jgi:hypothetical protein
VSRSNGCGLVVAAAVTPLVSRLTTAATKNRRLRRGRRGSKKRRAGARATPPARVSQCPGACSGYLYCSPQSAVSTETLAQNAAARHRQSPVSWRIDEKRYQSPLAFTLRRCRKGRAGPLGPLRMSLRRAQRSRSTHRKEKMHRAIGRRGRSGQVGSPTVGRFHTAPLYARTDRFCVGGDEGPPSQAAASSGPTQTAGYKYI